MSEVQENQLMSPLKFNKGVIKWTAIVRNVAVEVLNKTNGSGKLKRSFKRRLLDDREGGPVYVGVGFRFYRYGAYREYGAGRGYIVKDGVIMRGYSAWANKKTRKKYLESGMSEYRLRRYRTEEPYGIYTSIKRKPLAWLDPAIDKNINSLADLANEYYGDYALQKILNNFEKLKIKHYGKK